MVSFLLGCTNLLTIDQRAPWQACDFSAVENEFFG